ncbi:MAG TPA: PaaI family thioesterase [Candidatus Angelobacter sp.]|nr:PaaI family thioesterase [Candidatus Angelobacter sp.]
MPKPKPLHGHVSRGHSKHVTRPQNHCFACGKDNPHGMHLKFFIDEAKRVATCNVKLTRRYQGPPGHAHGGIIAVILDEAMGKINKLSNVIALTRCMNVEYLKPVPLGQMLTVTGRAQSINGREHTNLAEISNQAGEVLARSSGLFIAVDVAKMFSKFIDPS